MKKISFVYFDVGGVMIQDFSESSKWVDMIGAMGIPPTRIEEFNQLYDSYDDKICLGLHEDTLLPTIASHFSLTLPPNFSMRQYFLDHFERNSSIWPIAAKLKKTKPVGLLTDMYPGMLAEIVEKKLFPPIKWDQIIDSSKLNCRKPASQIYQIAQSKANVLPREILFIDNREKNLVPARELGWQTFLYDSNNYKKSSKGLAQFLDLSDK